MKAVRVLVVDGHELVRVGVKAILGTCPQYMVCGEAGDGRAAVEQTIQLRPDLVILEAGLRVLNGLEAARQILAYNPRFRILIFTEVESEQIMREALEMGVCGFVLKRDPASDLLAAAEALMRGRTFFTSRMTMLIVDMATSQRRVPILTRREIEVVQLVAEGNSNKEIARILNVSAKTVEAHRTNLRRKLKINSTQGLVIYAVRNHMVRLPQTASLSPGFGSDLDTTYLSAAAQSSDKLAMAPLSGTETVHELSAHGGS
ncbi:MAG: DNA-binding response regulator [Acidobacteria bacterium]|jgi:DNA-binding NarL/FixJ family response regulator|nr:MAG: DNA-binding response regulator [Acidobacteriota bacterium]